ncbi:MAG TPA: hypothetical protein PLL04_08265 [Thauera sp.]|nr:hypothetical protein [Thauera sp.]
MQADIGVGEQWSGVTAGTPCATFEQTLAACRRRDVEAPGRRWRGLEAELVCLQIGQLAADEIIGAVGAPPDGKAAAATNNSATGVLFMT